MNNLAKLGIPTEVEKQLVDNHLANYNVATETDFMPIVKYVAKRVVEFTDENEGVEWHKEHDSETVEALKEGWSVTGFGRQMCWLFSEYDPENELFFGIADLGLGFPEMGYTSLADMVMAKEKYWAKYYSKWSPTTTLSRYADNARLRENLANVC